MPSGYRAQPRFLRVREVLKMTAMSRSFIYAQMPDGRGHLSQADPPGCSHHRLERTRGGPVDGRPHGIPMTPPGGDLNTRRTLCWQGTPVLCLFLCLPEIVCGAKSFKAFPFVRSRRALPRSSAVLHRLMGVLGNVLGNFRRNHPEVVQDCVRASKKWRIGLPPSPFPESPEKSQEVPFSCERSSSWH